MKSIQIFRPGRHTAMSGAVIEFTESDVQAMVAAYDPAVSQAPIVVGHPKHDDPAYGWVKSLRFADGVVHAEPDQVDPDFAETVKAGRFKYVSASLYAPTAPSNPKPGNYYVRHVGFLGGAAPAVKGLKPVSFADNEAGVIEFGDFIDAQNAGMWRRLRDWIIGKYSLEEADKVIPDYAVASLEDGARANDTPAAVPAYSEKPHQENSMKLTPEQIAALQEQNAALKTQLDAINAKTTEFAERESKIKAAETQAQRAGVTAFVEERVKAGQILPRDQAGLVEFMAGLSADIAIEFGEGEARLKQPAAEWFNKFLQALPKIVDYSERAAADEAAGKGAAMPRAPHGYTVDPQRQELHGKALAYAEQHKTDYITAIAAVSH